ncbi:MAG: type II toxin-antitoxin system RelE family toxin [Thermoplasmatota archaeon]
MTYRVLVSATFAKQLKALPNDVQRRVRGGLVALGTDPLTPRPRADIKDLKATEPRKHRLRNGAYRIIYRVEGGDVKVIEIFSRGRG